MPIPVNLSQPQGRTRGSLLAAAQQIPSTAYVGRNGAARWVKEGISWNPPMFVDLTHEEANCDTVYDKTPSDVVDWLTFTPFLVWASLQCTRLSGMKDYLVQQLNYSIDDLVSFAFAAELETAAGSGSFSLAGTSEITPAVVTGSPSPIGYALAELEEHLAETLHGALGMIHMTPAALTLANSADLVQFDGDNFRTITGHTVVADAGYTGSESPFGWGDPVAGTEWIYATSQVFYDMTAVQDGVSFSVDDGDFDFSRNVDRPLVERHGILVFDPNHTAAAAVDLTVDALVFGS